MDSLSNPSRGLCWVWVGRQKERRGRVNRRGLWGMGCSLVWGEEAREGGVLTVVEEALRCSMRNFLQYPPPTGHHHPTLLTPALQRPIVFQATITQSFPPLSTAWNVPTRAFQPVDITLKFCFSTVSYKITTQTYINSQQICCDYILHPIAYIDNL